MKTIARVIAALLLSAAASNLAFGQSKATGGPTPSPEGAKVYFVDLKDGATIRPQTTVHFGLHGMGVAPAGSGKGNSGHHHLLLDTELPAPGGAAQPQPPPPPLSRSTPCPPRPRSRSPTTKIICISAPARPKRPSP